MSFIPPSNTPKIPLAASRPCQIAVTTKLAPGTISPRKHLRMTGLQTKLTLFLGHNSRSVVTVIWDPFTTIGRLRPLASGSPNGFKYLVEVRFDGRNAALHIQPDSESSSSLFPPKKS
nr:hypothetical protein [uncultured Desulfobulbus sp.]